MTELSQDQKNLLAKALPAAAIKPHPTKTFLSSINSIYVVERLNDVFGVGKWTQTSKLVMRIKKIRAKTQNEFWEIVLKCTLTIPEYGIILENYGGNDNDDLGDAFKGAMTDALTKMASYLGIGMDIWKGLPSNKNYQPATIKEPIKEPIKDVTPPPPDKVDAIIKIINSTHTLESLQMIWKALPLEMKKNLSVIDAKDAKKDWLSQPQPESIEDLVVDAEFFENENELLASLAKCKTATDWEIVWISAIDNAPYLNNDSTIVKVEALKATKKLK